MWFNSVKKSPADTWPSFFYPGLLDTVPVAGLPQGVLLTPLSWFQPDPLHLSDFHTLLIFRSTPPLQAQLVDLRSELTEAKAERTALEREVHDQLLQLHAVQLQLHAKQGQAGDSDTIKDRLVGRRRRCCPQPAKWDKAWEAERA